MCGSKSREAPTPGHVQCCCQWGAAVGKRRTGLSSGEYPEFGCQRCPVHQGAAGELETELCGRHRKAAGDQLAAVTPSGFAPAPVSLLAQTVRSCAGKCRSDLASTSLDIGVDLDGVVYDFVQALRHYIHQVTGRPLASMGPATSWHFYADNWGLSLDQFLEFFHAGVAAGSIFATGVPFPGVVTGLRALLDAGHRVHVVTDRASMGPAGKAEQSTRAWLADAGVPYTTLTLTGDKTSVPTDVFIEDRPEFFTALSEAGVLTYLRSHTYNAHVQCSPCRRVPDFATFVARVLGASA